MNSITIPLFFIFLRRIMAVQIEEPYYMSLFSYSNDQCAGTPQGIAYVQQDICIPSVSSSYMFSCGNNDPILRLWLNTTVCSPNTIPMTIELTSKCTTFIPSFHQGYQFQSCNMGSPNLNEPPELFPGQGQDKVYINVAFQNHEDCSLHQNPLSVVYLKTEECIPTSIFVTQNLTSDFSAQFDCFEHNQTLRVDAFLDSVNCQGPSNQENMLLKKCQTVKLDYIQSLVGFPSCYFPENSDDSFRVFLITTITGTVFYLWRQKSLQMKRGLTEYEKQLIQEHSVTLIDINKLRWDEDNCVGKGAFGKVYKGMYQDTQVAVKVQFTQQFEDILKELGVQFKLPKHKNVVELIGFCPIPVCLVLEFCENGSLKTYLSKTKEISETQVLDWLRGIAAGMHHIHANQIVHRDLAARNVLLAHNLVAKIADFGMSRLVEKDEVGVTQSKIGPVKWMAPECIKERKYSAESDVWSFAMVILEILTRNDPYPDYTITQFLFNFHKLSQNTASRLPSFSPAYIRELFVMCTQYDARKRPSFFLIVDYLDSKCQANPRTRFARPLPHNTRRMSYGTMGTTASTSGEDAPYNNASTRADNYNNIDSNSSNSINYNNFEHNSDFVSNSPERTHKFSVREGLDTESENGVDAYSFSSMNSGRMRNSNSSKKNNHKKLPRGLRGYSWASLPNFKGNHSSDSDSEHSTLLK